MKFSNRTSFGVSSPNALTLLLEKKKASGVPVLDFTESNPTKCGFSAHTDLSFADPTYRIYDPDPRGMIRAREAVCAYYAEKKVPVRPADVFLTCGTSEAYSMLFHLLCEPGEEVLCQSPAYPLLDHLAAYAGIAARRFNGVPTDTLSAGGQAGKAKALLVVNPANPTGRYVSGEAWRQIDGFCEKNGMAVISDEVFFDFDWQDRPRTSGASRSNGLHFTLGGVSKMLGLPQMKLAWIVLSGPERERREAADRLEAVADAFLSVNTLSQTALPSWLKNRDAFIGEVKRRVKTNFMKLEKTVKHVLSEPEGGWYALVPVPKGCSDEDLALRLLEKYDLLVHPGYFFDLEEECLVVSLLPEPSLFSEGARRLAEGTEAL